MGFGAAPFLNFPRPPDEGWSAFSESLKPPGNGVGLSDGSIRASDDGFVRLGHFGYLQLALLFLLFFLYVGFRIYARKCGEWETDEEQD